MGAVEMESQEQRETRDLWALAREISTPQDAEIFFTRLMRENENHSDPTVQSLLNSGIQNLMECSRVDAVAGGEIIKKYLLPLCLEQDTLLSPTLLDPRQAREILANWLVQYSDESRIPLRAQILRVLADILEAAPSVASIRTLASVGLRSPWTLRTLIRFVDDDGPVGDAAIDSICAFSPGQSLKARLVTAVLRRHPRSQTAKHDYAIQELASARFVPILSKRLLRGGSDVWRAASLLGSIADRVPGDQIVQNRVWQVFETALNAGLESGKGVLVGGNALAECNSSEVVRSLLKYIGQPGFGLHPIANYLSACVRPEQLKGWHTAGKVDLKANLTSYATLAGGATRSMTAEDYMRRSAWETALSAGITDVFDWLFWDDERSPFMLADMYSFASFVVLSKWPPLMTRLVTERVDIRDNNSLIRARLAGAQAIAATESLEGLKTLIDFGLTADGAPLRSTTELVGDLVDRLAGQCLGDLLPYLFVVCKDRGRGNGRMSAIIGLQRLAAAGLIPDEYLDSALSLVKDDSLPHYATAAVIWIVACFQDAKHNTAFVERLLSYLDDPTTSVEVKFQSLQALIHLEGWMDHKPAVLRALDVLPVDHRIAESRLQSYGGWQSYALGLLVGRDPELFRQPAKQVLEGADGQAVHLLLRALDRGERRPADILVELGRSAIRRTTQVLARSFGETDNFQILSRLAPSEFVRADWEALWGEWMPQVRSALADALHHIPESDEYERTRILELLAGLLSDSTYAVRRSAARSYARRDENGLNQLCRRWIRAGQTGLRVRCAEIAQWLSVDNLKMIDNSILRSLDQDPEPSVRSAAKRSRSELRNREWRNAALSRITSGDPQDGDRWVSECYCYGRALVALGDDDTIAALRDLQRERETPVNVKNWLKYLIEEIEKHWREVANKWPEPLLAWSGQLEEFESEFVLGHRRLTSTISLWLRRQSDPTDTASWGGGFIIPSIRDRMQMVLNPQSEPVPLAICGRRSAQIWYSGSTESQVLFVGTGPYPHRIDPYPVDGLD